MQIRNIPKELKDGSKKVSCDDYFSLFNKPITTTTLSRTMSTLETHEERKAFLALYKMPSTNAVQRKEFRNIMFYSCVARAAVIHVNIDVFKAHMMDRLDTLKDQAMSLNFTPETEASFTEDQLKEVDYLGIYIQLLEVMRIAFNENTLATAMGGLVIWTHTALACARAMH